MPDDNRTHDQSNDPPFDPQDDLIAPIVRLEVHDDSRRPTAPNALSNIVKADHDALVTDEELLSEARNEMPSASASKVPHSVEANLARTAFGRLSFVDRDRCLKSPGHG